MPSWKQWEYLDFYIICIWPLHFLGTQTLSKRSKGLVGVNNQAPNSSSFVLSFLWFYCLWAVGMQLVTVNSCFLFFFFWRVLLPFWRRFGLLSNLFCGKYTLFNTGLEVIIHLYVLYFYEKNVNEEGSCHQKWFLPMADSHCCMGRSQHNIVKQLSSN